MASLIAFDKLTKHSTKTDEGIAQKANADEKSGGGES